MVICQCGLAWCTALDTAGHQASRPAWSLLPLPSKSRFTPSRFFASTSCTSDAARRGPAVGSAAILSRADWSKHDAVSTTRSPAACARVMRSARAWLW